MDALVARAREKGLATDAHWLRLGHYRPTFTGGWRSQADGPAFFLSPDGRDDPAAELEATLRAFFQPVTPEHASPDLQHPQCRFPARLAYLRDRLPLDDAPLPRPHCAKLDDFVARVAARSVTFAFSSYHLGNPGSVFGHTFLRLDKDETTPDGRRKELLDWGVNFAAEVDDRNSILYVVRGLTGGYRGLFSHLPYFYKVREYNDYESRDLWEYRLALTPDEVEQLVLHLWELGGTWFDYFYIDENCSYHLLSALEVAAPRLSLLEQLPPHVLPSDALKAVVSTPGLVLDVHHRPSLRSQFERRAAGLDASQLDRVRALADDPAAALDGSPEAQARVLDAAMDYLDLTHAKEIVHDPPPELSDRRHRLLVRRAKLGVPSAPLPDMLPEESAPHLSHPSMRLGVGGGVFGPGGTFAQLSFRPLLHDFADPHVGYPEHTRMELLPLTLRYELPAHRVRLEEWKLLRITNLTPLTRFAPVFSWDVQLGVQTIRDGGCDGCLAAGGRAGAGVTVAPFDGPLNLYLLANAALEGGPSLRGAFGTRLRPSVGPEVGLRWRTAARYATHLTAGAWWHGEDRLRASWYLDWVHRLHLTGSFSLELRARRHEDGLEAGAGAHFFY